MRARVVLQRGFERRDAVEDVDKIGLARQAEPPCDVRPAQIRIHHQAGNAHLRDGPRQSRLVVVLAASLRVDTTARTRPGPRVSMSSRWLRIAWTPSVRGAGSGRAAASGSDR